MEQEPSALSFDDYVAARWSRLVRSTVLMGVDLHAAEDLVQTALARCYFKWERVVQARDPDAYVYRTLINALRESKRRRWVDELPTSDLPEPDVLDSTTEVDQSQVLLAALKELPEKQRQVVVLRFYADFSETQTAHALGIAVGTVKSRASRALTALAADLLLDRQEQDPRR